MRWLLLFAAAVLVAVGLWVFLPRDPEAKAAAGAAEPVRRDLRHEPPRTADLIIEHGLEPAAAANAPTDAGSTVDATFEVMTDAGRIAGTRITLRNDAGVSLSGLTDNFGLAHLGVTPGLWEVASTIIRPCIA